MKRVLLLGIILAIFILAMPQGVSASTLTPQNVIVNAGYAGADLKCTPATTIGTGSGQSVWTLTKALNPNQKTGALTFDIESTRAYTITAQDQKAPTNEGYMTVSDGGTRVLANTFDMQMGGVNNVMGSRANIIRTGTPPSSPKLVVGGPPVKTILSSDVWQPIADSDWSSTSPYSITVVFTCSSDW
jgi:hypothetical protein